MGKTGADIAVKLFQNLNFCPVQDSPVYPKWHNLREPVNEFSMILNILRVKLQEILFYTYNQLQSTTATATDRITASVPNRAEI